LLVRCVDAAVQRDARRSLHSVRLYGAAWWMAALTGRRIKMKA